MAKYESPKINFDKLMFFEKIADRCWAANKVDFNDPFEYPQDCGIETKIKIKSLNPNCGKDELQSFVKGVRNYLNVTYHDHIYFKAWYDLHVATAPNHLQNTHLDTTYIPIS